MDPHSNQAPGPNFAVVFGPPLKYLDLPLKQVHNVLVDQFTVFLGHGTIVQVCQSKVRIQLSLAEVKSQNVKWKTENNGRRETATSLPSIKMTKEMVNSERLWRRQTLGG